MEPPGTAWDARESNPDAKSFPAGARVAAALVGVLVGVWFSATAAALYADGLVLTGIVMPALTLPFALFLVLVGLVPAGMQRALSRVSRVNLRDGGHVFALIVVTLGLFLIFALGSLVDGVYAYETVVLGRGNGDGGFPDVTEAALLQGLVFNVVLFSTPPIVWLTFVRDESVTSALRALGFRSQGAPRAAAEGVAFAVVVIVGLTVVTAALVGLGVPVPENEQALDIAAGVSVTGAFLVATLSSLGEEIFFRGFLFPRVGFWPQAVLFAIAHLSYVHALQIVVTFVLALGFAWLYKRSGNLWAPIAAHFAFNLIMLLLPRVADV